MEAERKTRNSRLLLSLIAVDREYPVDRKRFVCSDINFGRETLLALARETGGWVGWEAVTLRGIAEELAFLPLARAQKHVTTDIQIGALVNRALGAAISEDLVRGSMQALRGSLGFRRALRDAVLELRTAGIDSATVRDAASADSASTDVAAVLEGYERLLDERRTLDPAGLFRAALAAFDDEAVFVLDGITLLAPGLIARGLPGLLVERLLSHGAHVLRADIPVDIEPPPALLAARTNIVLAPHHLADGDDARTCALAWAGSASHPRADDARLDSAACEVDFFCASTPSAEMRELCRRVVAEGLSWDEVEIVATDTDTYGIALDALSQNTGIGVTMLNGIPLSRTRLGRALERWLSWLEQGLPVDVLRQALEAGELSAPNSIVSASALARELRLLEIGWGRARYEMMLEKLESSARLVTYGAEDDAPDDDVERLQTERRSTRSALAALLASLLAIAPPIPERDAVERVDSSCVRLARATLAWLRLVPMQGEAEEQTATRLRKRLALLADVDEENAPFASALAELREALGDLRAWPFITSERKPWSSAGGMMHLTDVAHAGTTGRARTFVVGLDADRTAGASTQDPLLPDSVKNRIAGGALPTTAERRHRSSYALAMSLASLRGRVTLSYAISADRDGRQASPSMVLLQAYRIARGNGTLTYEALRESLTPPVSAVLRRGANDALCGVEPLDGRDVWLDTVADGPLLLDGDALVRAEYPSLDAGLASAAAYAGDVLTPYHGIVAAAAGAFDPSTRTGRAISPSSFELLSACPLAWFYKYALELREPRELAFDPDRWLDNAQRGLLLHEVFEQFVRDFQDRQPSILEPVAADTIRDIVNAQLVRWKSDVPPPGEAVFESEARELHESARAFLQMERSQATGPLAGRWLRVELDFGSGDDESTIRIDATSLVRIRGRVDRVDALDDGTLRVVDYKTGKPGQKYSSGTTHGAYNGGRQLQPAVYAAAVSARIDRAVSRFEYRFPTERGQNEIVGYDRDALASAAAVIPGLLEYIRTGVFLATNDGNDCGFCAYRENCRAPDSPSEMPLRVRWATEHADAIEEYRSMLSRRAAPEKE